MKLNCESAIVQFASQDVPATFQVQLQPLKRHTTYKIQLLCNSVKTQAEKKRLVCEETAISFFELTYISFYRTSDYQKASKGGKKNYFPLASD